MRILFLSTDFKPKSGGIAELSYQVCRELAARGHSVVVVTQGGPGLPEDESRDAFRVTRPLRPFSAAQASWRRIVENQLWGLHAGRVVRQAVRAQRPEVVFAGNAHATWGNILPACGRPYFVFLHGEDVAATLVTHVPGRRASCRRMLEHAHGTFWNSTYSASLARALCGRALPTVCVVGCGYPPEQIVAEPDGAAARQRLGWPAGPVLLTVARVILRKGIDTVLRALPEVRGAFPEVRYVVVGNGPDRAALARLADELRLGACVQFLGVVPEAVKRDAYLASSLYVMPSRPGPEGEVEGFGISYLEANAHGLAVVGSRAGGIPDAVGDGENGVLVDPHDVAGLARAVIALLGQPDRCRDMARVGQERIRTRYNWKHIVDQIEARLVAAVAASPERPAGGS